MGYSHAKVVRNVRAAVIATGSELTEPGSELSFGKIYNANLYLVCSRLTELGVSVVWMDTVQDDARCLKDSIEKACRMGCRLDSDNWRCIGWAEGYCGGNIWTSWCRDLFPRSEDEARIPDDGRKLSENPDA